MRPHELQEGGEVVCHVDELIDHKWHLVLITSDRAFAHQLAEGFGSTNGQPNGRVQEFARRAKKGRRRR